MFSKLWERATGGCWVESVARIHQHEAPTNGDATKSALVHDFQSSEAGKWSLVCSFQSRVAEGRRTGNDDVLFKSLFKGLGLLVASTVIRQSMIADRRLCQSDLSVVHCGIGQTCDTPWVSRQHRLQHCQFTS